MARGRPIGVVRFTGTVPLILVIAAGGAVGALARAAVAEVLVVHDSLGWTWATLAVNLLGALAIGVVATSRRVGDGPDWLRPFLITGVLGGFTTFSAIALELGLLLDAGRVLSATGYLLATLLGGLAAVQLGLLLTRRRGSRLA